MKVTTKNAKRTMSKPRPKQSRVMSSPRQAPVSQSNVIRKLGRPKISRVGDAGDIIVIHREYISDLVASATAGAFAVAGIPINPGNSSLFPWLSGIASQFESYVFRGLKFLFETAAPTSTPGTVLMAVDYDVSDSLPANKSEMMSLRDATRSAAWERNMLDCSREDLHKRKTYYVGQNASNNLPIAANQPLPPASGDDRLDDVGELILASSNSTSSAPLGEMYVEYEVALMTPQGGAAQPDYYSAYKVGVASSQGPTTPFGFASLFVNGDADTFVYPGLGIVYADGAAGSYFIFTEPGTYSYSISTAVATSLGSITTTIDTYSSSANQKVNEQLLSSTTTAMASGLFIVNNTVPQTFSLGSTGETVYYALGWFRYTLSGGTFSSSTTNRIRVSRLPDYTANSSVGTGFVTLAQVPKPPKRLGSLARRKKQYPPEFFDLSVAGKCQESEKTSNEGVHSENPRKCSEEDTFPPNSVLLAEPEKLCNFFGLRGVRVGGK